MIDNKVELRRDSVLKMTNRLLPKLDMGSTHDSAAANDPANKFISKVPDLTISQSQRNVQKKAFAK